jgi:hypothetical protein
MDNPGVDRQGSGIIRRFPKRLRVSLKVMLLTVTLFCVLCGYYRVHRDKVLRAELAELRVRIDDLKDEIDRSRYGPTDPEWSLLIRDANDRIEEINKQLGVKRDGKK